MRKIPKNLREELTADPYYLTCARRDEHECDGRITWEHAFKYSGQQINEKWSIIPLCWKAHLGIDLNKKRNQQIALSRASAADLAKYPKIDWQQMKRYLKINL